MEARTRISISWKRYDGSFLASGPSLLRGYSPSSLLIFVRLFACKLRLKHHRQPPLISDAVPLFDERFMKRGWTDAYLRYTRDTILSNLFLFVSRIPFTPNLPNTYLRKVVGRKVARPTNLSMPQSPKPILQLWYSTKCKVHRRNSLPLWQGRNELTETVKRKKRKKKRKNFHRCKEPSFEVLPRVRVKQA